MRCALRDCKVCRGQLYLHKETGQRKRLMKMRGEEIARGQSGVRLMQRKRSVATARSRVSGCWERTVRRSSS